jgi:beta-barrel assembly-enhancing protease
MEEQGGARTGWLFDGQSAHRWPVNITLRMGELRVERLEGGGIETIDMTQLTWAEPRKDAAVFGHVGREGWRLGIEGGPLPDSWLHVLPRKMRLQDRIDALSWKSGLALLVVAVIGFYWMSNHIVGWAVPLVPTSWQNTVGEAVVESFTEKSGTCEGAAGKAALQRLSTRLFPMGSLAEPITLHVIDEKEANAFAAPGGHVALFSGLIADAKSPDVVAGVLAHELGHVKNRHALRSLIRGVGFGIIISSVGGNVGSAVDTFLTLSRSRDYEREADQEAIAALKRINASPKALADFFAELDKQASDGKASATAVDDLFTYVSTHPGADERRETLLAAVDPNQRYAPSMSDADWQAIKAMCGPPKE